MYTHNTTCMYIYHAVQCRAALHITSYTRHDRLCITPPANAYHNMPHAAYRKGIAWNHRKPWSDM